jgi:hypothetical protein
MSLPSASRTLTTRKWTVIPAHRRSKWRKGEQPLPRCSANEDCGSRQVSIPTTAVVPEVVTSAPMVGPDRLPLAVMFPFWIVNMPIITFPGKGLCRVPKPDACMPPIAVTSHSGSELCQRSHPPSRYLSFHYNSVYPPKCAPDLCQNSLVFGVLDTESPLRRELSRSRIYHFIRTRNRRNTLYSSDHFISSRFPSEGWTVRCVCCPGCREGFIPAHDVRETSLVHDADLRRGHQRGLKNPKSRLPNKTTAVREIECSTFSGIRRGIA